jgi:hypothetical protein
LKLRKAKSEFVSSTVFAIKQPLCMKI